MDGGGWIWLSVNDKLTSNRCCVAGGHTRWSGSGGRRIYRILPIPTQPKMARRFRIFSSSVILILQFHHLDVIVRSAIRLLSQYGSCQ